MVRYRNSLKKIRCNQERRQHKDIKLWVADTEKIQNIYFPSTLAQYLTDILLSYELIRRRKYIELKTYIHY